MLRQKPYVIVHLSDLHLTPNNSVGRTEVSLPGQNLHGMNRTFKNILASEEIQTADTILITGDITDKGDTASWRVFNNALVKAGVKKKTLIVAGNHDVCEMGKLPDLGEIFETLTGAAKRRYMKRLSENLKSIKQPVRYPWGKVIDEDLRRVMIIGIDTNHSGHFSFADNAIGRIGKSQLKKIKGLVKKHSDQNDKKNYIPVRIIAMHHSPNIPRTETLVKRGIVKERWLGDKLLNKWSGFFTRWTHQIPAKDRRALRKLCVDNKVRLLAHGHMHEAMDRRVNGIRHIGTPASTQPVTNSNNEYQFYKYSIVGDNNILKPKLVTLTLNK